eukprot:3561473-Rhodomonas_salina.2
MRVAMRMLMLVRMLVLMLMLLIPIPIPIPILILILISSSPHDGVGGGGCRGADTRSSSRHVSSRGSSTASTTPLTRSRATPARRGACSSFMRSHHTHSIFARQRAHLASADTHTTWRCSRSPCCELLTRRVLDELYMLVLEADPVESCDEEEQAQKMLRIAAEMLEAMNTISFECAGVVQNPQVKIGIAFGQAYCALVGVKHTYVRAHFPCRVCLRREAVTQSGARVQVTYFGQAVREACTCCTQGFPQCIVTTRM